MSSSVSQGISRLIVLGVAMLGGLALSVMAGRAVATEDYKWLAMVFAGAVGIGFMLWIGKNIHILLAVAMSISGSIGVLPLPFSYQEMIIFASFGLTLMYAAFKKIDIETRTISLDLPMYLNLGYMITVYMRNPVGFRALGSDMVGGRPYLIVITAFLFYFAITQYKISPKLAPKMPLIIAAPAVLLSFVSMLAFKVPIIAKVVFPFWSGVGLTGSVIEAAGGTAAAQSNIVRLPGTMVVGQNTVQLLCAYFPAALFLSPMSFWPFAAFSLAMVVWLASGFRSGILVYGSYIFYNCWLRRRLQDLFPAALAGSIAIALLLVGQGTIFNLPVGMQRSLSFLPGNWDREAVSDAEGSTEWRLQIWGEVWNNPEFIKDRVFGDGFGFSAYDLKIQLEAVLGGQGYMDGTKAQMVTGAYHNGPLSTIRYVGIVGLILYTFLQFSALVYGAKLVRRAWGTPYQPLAIFLSIPLLYLTFSFYVIFGGFDSDFPRLIFTIGLLKVTALSLTDYLAKKKTDEDLAVASPSVEAIPAPLPA